MKAIEMGKYFIRVTSKKHNSIKLNESNMLALSDGEINSFNSALDFNRYDAVFYVHLLEDYEEIAIIFDKSFKSNGEIFHACVGKPFMVSSIECEIVFECDDNNLESAIYAFKDNRLTGDYDIKSLLMQYAKMNVITEKQAVCYIVTTIDVPEVEG